MKKMTCQQGDKMTRWKIEKVTNANGINYLL